MRRRIDLFGKKHHDLVAALHELAHGIDGQRLVGQHCQVIELLAEHRNVLGILVLENVFDQCMVCLLYTSGYFALVVS